MIKVTNCPVCNHHDFAYFLTAVDHTLTKEPFHLVVCKNCNFLMTNPQPSPHKIGNYYRSDNYISHSGKSTSLVDSIYLFVRKRALRWKISLLPSGKGALLDYGCGTGEFLKTCQESGWTINGVELSVDARKKAEALTGIAISPAFTKVQNTYDVITLWHVLEHIADLKMLLQDLKDSLKADGSLFIAVPNYESYDAQHYNKLWAGYDVPRHLWHFSQSTMQQLLKNNGLKIVETIPMKLDSFYVSLLSEKYKGQNGMFVQLIKGTLIGLLSNWKARKNKNYSSLIYIVKRNGEN